MTNDQSLSSRRRPHNFTWQVCVGQRKQAREFYSFRVSMEVDISRSTIGRNSQLKSKLFYRSPYANFAVNVQSKLARYFSRVSLHRRSCRQQSNLTLVIPGQHFLIRKQKRVNQVLAFRHPPTKISHRDDCKCCLWTNFLWQSTNRKVSQHECISIFNMMRFTFCDKVMRDNNVGHYDVLRLIQMSFERPDFIGIVPCLSTLFQFQTLFDLMLKFPHGQASANECHAAANDRTPVTGNIRPCIIWRQYRPDLQDQNCHHTRKKCSRNECESQSELIYFHGETLTHKAPRLQEVLS